MKTIQLLLLTFTLPLVFFLSTKTSYAAVRVPILTYHYISVNPNPADKARYPLSVPPDIFDKQLQQLRMEGYTPITLNELPSALAGKGPAKPIILSFDDGYMDFYYNAFPILQKYGFHAVSFIPTGLISNKNYYMTWDQMREIQRSGLVDFEDHTTSHAYLPKLSLSQMQYEMSNSRQKLESELGIQVNFIAYPYGATSTIVEQAARKIGYLGGFGTWKGKVTAMGMDMPRVRINSTTDFSKGF